MDPPKSKTTIRISANMGNASQYANSLMTVVELKGKTPQEKGDHYLLLSLGALEELASLLEDSRLSDSEKVAYNKVYNSNMMRYDAMVQLRDQLLAQKKSFRRFLMKLFVRDSEATRFYQMTYWTYSAIRRTSEELHRRFLPIKDATLGQVATSGSHELGPNVSVCEESPRDVVEGNVLVKDLPPNEAIRGINLDVHTVQEENKVLRILNRIAAISGEEGDDDDDDSKTIRPSTSQSTPPSPSPSCTFIYHINSIHNSVLSYNSEVMGATINTGVNEGTVSHPIHTDSEVTRLLAEQ